MIKIETRNIKGNDDLELNIKRSAPLTYHIAYDTTKRPNGVIFSIPGFGRDADINYQLNLIQYIAKKYNLVAVCVEYHCYFNRIYNGASYDFNSFDKNIFLDIVSRYNIKLDPENSDFEYMANKLNEYVKNEKQKDSSYKNYRENIFATIQPKKNEYQNFGILQTIDILSVLYDLKDIGFNDIIENKPLFAFGSSHGAYITNLLMKFAPNTFDAILENSAYVKPPLMYIVGQEYNS